MFKLTELSLYGEKDGEVFSYFFTDGINYFKGKNDSGKTEFYIFLDYMFGASTYLADKDWYRESLSHASLTFSYNHHEFIITRFLKDINKNQFRYLDETASDYIRLDEYCAKLNAVFAISQVALKELHDFVEEELSFRSFTVFNFFGENRQGVLNDFFDKCSNLKYSIKMPAILNYIFNRNLARLSELKKREEYLKAELEKLEKRRLQNDEICARVNHQLKILGLKKVFTGANTEGLIYDISNLQQSIEKNESAEKTLAITELEAIYTSLDEQIKKQKNSEFDHQRFVDDEVKQKVLLERLREIAEQKPDYVYLIDPIINLTENLDKSISFNKYLIQENTTKELKKQRDKIKQKILANKSRFTIYSASEKSQAITLIKEYLGYFDADFDKDNFVELKKELKQIREEIRILQNGNDTEKINALSADITRLYKSSTEISDLAEYDFRKDGFQIAYLKNGNNLQPQIVSEEKEDNDKLKNFYTGSKARHTLIQLCGYLAFLRMMIQEKKYPMIPLLVIDHISQPFDNINGKAIGAVLHNTYNEFLKCELQIILFDDEDASNLGITPDLNTNLLGDGKSGFNPYYHMPSKADENSSEKQKREASENTVQE